jgi:hypothetical protein
LVRGSNGALFGTTPYGGAYQTTNCGGAGLGCGTIFKLHGTGLDTLTVLRSLCKQGLPDCPDGDEPADGTLLLDASGNLFGAAQAGGKNTGGTVFELTP